MKTFKLVLLAIYQEEEFSEIDLMDGLIINKEDGDNRWMIEAYMDKQYLELFEQRRDSNEEMQLQVTISKKTNDPASIVAHVKSVNVMQDYMSVLFDGILFRSKIDLAEMILASLIEQGLQGDELLAEFKNQLNQKRSKPVAK